MRVRALTGPVLGPGVDVSVIEGSLSPSPPEREMEDHEQVVEIYSSWPREHSNVFLFKQNDKKYDLFEDPIVSVHPPLSPSLPPSP